MNVHYMYILAYYSTYCVQCQHKISKSFFMLLIGKKLKELRNSEKLTQKQLAEALNIRRENYTRYENDKVRPDYETLIVIADFYNITLDELFDRDNKI